MRRNSLKLFLIFEALLCILLNLQEVSSGGIFKSVMAFPFEQIGLALRSLSLSGDMGNAVAIGVYVLLCLLPLIILAIQLKKRSPNLEDCMLGLLCPVLFAVFYMMINPGIIPSIHVGKAIVGCVVYLLFWGYLILRILRLFLSGGTKALLRYMVIMLYIMNILFVFLIFGACFGNLIDSIATVTASNTSNESALESTYVFLVLNSIVDALPHVFNICITFAALNMLCEIQKDRYSDEAVAAIKQMTRLCVKALAVVVISNGVFNLLQLVFINTLVSVNTIIKIPVLSIIFVLSGLLLARFIEENKQLKDENDQFV